MGWKLPWQRPRESLGNQQREIELPVAVFFDVGGNRQALEAILDAGKALGCRSFVSLGNLVGDWGAPLECLQIATREGIVCLAGFWEHQVLAGEFHEIGGPLHRVTMKWLFDQLQLEQFRDLVHVIEKHAVEAQCIRFTNGCLNCAKNFVGMTVTDCGTGCGDLCVIVKSDGRELRAKNSASSNPLGTRFDAGYAIARKKTPANCELVVGAATSHCVPGEGVFAVITATDVIVCAVAYDIETAIADYTELPLNEFQRAYVIAPFAETLRERLAKNQTANPANEGRADGARQCRRRS